MKEIVRYGGSAASAIIASVVAQFVQLPHGLPSGTFVFGMAPVSGFAGYEFGIWLGRTKMRRALWGAFFAIFAVPLLFVVYQWVLETASPGITTVVVLYFTFAAAVFAFFCAMGLLQVNIFEQKER